jgi:hypothetical protein
MSVTFRTDIGQCSTTRSPAHPKASGETASLCLCRGLVEELPRSWRIRNKPDCRLLVQEGRGPSPSRSCLLRP